MLALAPAAYAHVATYPSSATIRPTGPLPPGAGKAIVLHTGIGELEDGIAVISGAHTVTASVDKGTLGSIGVQLFLGHFVEAGGRLVPDALLPWDGTAKGTEHSNQPVWVQVNVPYGTNPGTYTGRVAITADGKPTNVPLEVKVFPVTLPAPGTATGNLLTSFHLSAETYLNEAASLYGFNTSDQYLTANAGLYAFLSRYRISPSSWGYGEPHSPDGYAESSKWWLNSAQNMVNELAVTEGFSAMRLPVSSNRATPRASIAGLSPFHPEGWCSYLQAVHTFWEQHGWTSGSVVPYLYGMDEPGLDGFHVVQKQAAVAHRCFPGSKVLVTGNPTQLNRFLWDNTGGDDVDIWVVLANRFYGKYTNPKQQRAHISYAHESYAFIQQVRSRGKMVWSYVYSRTKTPGFTTAEPLSNSRMFFLWAALEDVQGILYGEGTTSYKGNPFASVPLDGASVLLYPGAFSPVPSARLEQIRDGIEDWAIYEIAGRRHGAAAIRALLGGAGLFSAGAKGVELACSIGCRLRSPSPFSWPLYSHDSSTPGRIEAAKLQALELASK